METKVSNSSNRRKPGDSQRIHRAALEIGIHRAAIQDRFDLTPIGQKRNTVRSIAHEYGVSDRSLLPILELAGIKGFKDRAAAPRPLGPAEITAKLADLDRRLTAMETALGIAPSLTLTNE